LQLAPSISHFNQVEPRSDESERGFLDDDLIAISLGARFKVSPQTAIIFDYSQPLSNIDFDPEPGISLGAEFATSAHSFQIFITNYKGLVPQQNYMKNQNDFFSGDVLIGFNITRNYNF